MQCNNVNQNLNNESQTMNDWILGNLSTAILLLDDRMRVVFTNPAAENLLQESSAHMQGRCLTDILLNGSDLLNTISDAVTTNQLYTRRKMLLVLPGKDNVTADITVTPITEADQILVEFIPMDRYLRIDRDAAIQEHHDVTRQMVRGLAHEIKNPLGGIKGSAQLLAKELPDAGLEEFTDIIIEETDRLTALVDRMLGPNTLPQMRSTNIHEVMEKIARLIEIEADQSLTVVRDYDPSLPEVSIDPELMLQALLNVARNAMQCLEGTPHPTLTLTTRIERQFTINGKLHTVVLRVDINDNGPGIHEDIQEHLFFPMITRRPGGTGMGLTFAQSIISQHGGMIEFSSQPRDTTFRTYIPLETP